jgi:putative membrane protein
MPQVLAFLRRTWLLTLVVGLCLPALAFAHTGPLPLKVTGEFDWRGIAANWFSWDIHPSILIGTTLFVALYFLATTRWRVRYGWSDTPIDPRQRGMFLGSVALLYLTLDGPLHHIADDLLFCAHMLQHMILQLLWAPLIVLSVPIWLWQAVLRRPWVARTARLVTRPMVAFVLYNALVFGWHFPRAYNTALEVHNIHILQHIMFMSVSVLTWFVVLAPVPELRATYPRRMVFIFAHMLAMKALGLIISLSDHVLYTFYEHQPRVFGIDALGDQQFGGMLMWLPGGALLWAGLGRVWWQWVRSGTPERGSTGIPALDASRRAQLAARAPEPAPQPTGT